MPEGRACVRRALVCAGAAVCLVVTAQVAAGDGAGEPAGNAGLLVTDEMRADRAAAAARDAAERARRATPAARAERQASRTAFAGLGRLDALALAKERFPRVFGADAFVRWQPPAGQRVKRYIGDHAALLEGETDADRELVEAHGAPLTSKLGSGEPQPVDLALEPRGDGFGPRNPSVPTHIGPDGGVELGSDPMAVGVAAAVPEAPLESRGRVFYANALEDTDLTITPTTGGAAFAFNVRSADAPERAVLEFDLAAGLRLRAAAGVPEQVEIVSGADTVGHVLPPAAWDADGAPLAVGYKIDGDRLTVNFPHRGEDVAYPLHVDPLIEHFGYTDVAPRQWDEWVSDYHHGMSGNWGFQRGDITQGIPTSVWSGYETSFSNGDWAEWKWENPRGYIKTLEGVTVYHTQSGSCGYFGIEQANGVWQGYEPACGASNGWPVVNNSIRGYGDDALLQLYMNTTGYRATPARFQTQGVRVTLDDNELPTITGVTNTSGGAWLRENQQVTINPSATDAGLGMWAFNVYAAGNPVSWIRSNTVATTDYAQACKGTRGYRCPQGNVTGAITLNTNDLTEGDFTYTGSAFDALSQKSDYTTNIKVDRTKPTVTAAGTLYNARDTTVRGAQHKLTVGAGDQTGLSGVNRVEIKVNSTVYSVSPGSEWTFSDAVHGSSGASGATPVVTPYTIEVTSVDNAGNRSDPVSFQLNWSSQPCDGSPLA